MRVRFLPPALKNKFGDIKKSLYLDEDKEISYIYNKQMKTSLLHNQKSYRNTFSQIWLALPVVLIEDCNWGSLGDSL